MRLWRVGKIAKTAKTKYALVDDACAPAVLHIFRALLRQCTYLPDPAARQYIHDYVVSRFRDYHPLNTLPLSSPRHKSTALVQQRLPSLLRAARRGLVLLRRANDGHVRHLGKVLCMTYGRVGKRRDQLLKDLKIPDAPIDPDAIKELSEPANQDVPRPSERLMALVKSQARRRQTGFARNFSSKPPALQPEIPATNIWGRPTPIKRVRNIKREWYAKTLDRIMAPLSEAEWNRLGMRASGQLPWEGLVARRRWAGGPDDEGQTHMVGERVKSPQRGGCSNPHRITPRFMCRFWARIWEHCPLMKPNSTRKSGWEVLWGGFQGHTTTKLALRHKATGGYDLFGGVDENGRVVAEGQKPK